MAVAANCSLLVNGLLFCAFNFHLTCLVISLFFKILRLCAYYCEAHNQIYTASKTESLFSLVIHNFSRYTSIGLECGTFITFIVDLETNEVIEKLTFSFEGPLTKVIFFPTTGNIRIFTEN